MSDVAIAAPGTRLQNFLDRAGFHGFPWKTATILYTISWGWLFIVRDSLWADDWEMFTTYANLDLDRQGFAPWYQYLVSTTEFLGPTFARAIIFLAFFLAGLIMFGILQRFDLFAQRPNQMFVLLFLLLPFNTARVGLMTLNYSVSYFVFFFAWYLLVRCKLQNLYLCSLALFFLSFGMHSLLLVYFLPVLHRFLLSKVGSVRLLIAFARANFVMLLLPVLYWGLRSIFWPEEVAYHDVSLTSLLKTTYFVLISGGLLVIIFVLQLKLKAKKQSLQLIFAGILSIFLGIYAYVISGFFSPNWSFFSKYIETFLGRSDWYSRHQTLQPLGVALLIVGVIGLLPKFLKKFTKGVQALILAVCVVINIGFGFEYVVDYSKQKEVISVLKEEGEGKSESNYHFVDQTILLNARGRAYRERDWQGLIWSAYGVESMQSNRVVTTCESFSQVRLVLIQGPETHWEALKNWVSDGDMGFKVIVDDTPGACTPEMVTSERVSLAIPILFYFTGVKG